MQMGILTVRTKEEDYLKGLQINNIVIDSLDKRITSKANRSGIDGNRPHQGSQPIIQLIVIQLYRFDDHVPQVVGKIHVQLLQNIRKVPRIHQKHEDELL